MDRCRYSQGTVIVVSLLGSVVLSIFKPNSFEHQ